ncbi:MAG: F0F1 ATP synthase subunit A [Planctomycetota bacterium]
MDAAALVSLGDISLPLAWITEHLMEVEAIAGLSTIGISKHVLAMMLAGGILLAVFIPFGRRVAADPVPRGPMVNALESVLLFLRDEVVRPFLGEDGDRFLPVLWTFFFFILTCNLLGLVPLPIKVPVEGHGWSWYGAVTATGQMAVTGTLAAIAFVWYHGNGIRAQGLVPYVRHLVPGGVPLGLVPLIFVLEVVGHIVKPAALMIRLWANMTGGHAVLYAVINFVFAFGVLGLAYLVGAGAITVLGGFAVFCLEIFVAFLQAYVFTFLVVVFLGGALHPH